MPRLKLPRGGGSARRRSQQQLSGVYDADEEDELEVVSGRKGHSVDNATYVSVSEGVFKRVDIGTEDGSTGSKGKKVTIVDAAEPGSPSEREPAPDADGSYVTSLMKWLMLDEEEQRETDKNTNTVRAFHGVEPYEEPKPVKTIKPPSGKPTRPSSPLPSTMRQASRPRPTLSPDQLVRASSPRRPVSHPPRPLSPTTRRCEPQRPVSPPPGVKSDPPRERAIQPNKSSVSDSPANRPSLNRFARPPSIDLTAKKTKKPKVKRSPIVPVQSNRVRSSHRPFDHPSKSPAVFNRSVSARAPVNMTMGATPQRPVNDHMPLVLEASTSSTLKQETSKPVPSSSQEAVAAPKPADTAQVVHAGAAGTSHDADHEPQNAIEKIEAIERGSSGHMLCFCQPDDSQNTEVIEDTGVAETVTGENSIRKLESERTDAVSPARPRQSFLTAFLSCPALCLTDLDNREEHRDDVHSKDDEMKVVAVSTVPKQNGGGDSSTASSISLAQTATSTSTNTTGSSEGDMSTSSDDGYSLSDSDCSTAVSRSKKKKAYKLTVTFEPPAWLA